MSSSPVDYKLRITSKARRVSLRYDHRGLRIVSPRKISDKQAQELILKHYDWIEQQRQFFIPHQSKLDDGSEIAIFGDKEKIRYELTENASHVRESGTYLVVQAPAGKHQDALHTWLRRIARKGIIARVEELASLHGFTYNNISVRDQTSRWGSCSSERNLNFSWRLMLAPMPVLDYVIIHELAHTQQMNHSAAFWSIVRNCMPEYKQWRAWLKKEGQLLHQY